jgi:ATP-dependent RNA helicase DDX49/DBP8
LPASWLQVLQGKDVLGLAETGSGKTAAFALPILQKLAEDPYGIFALLMTPTRELAFQISDQFKALGSAMSLRCVVAVGGMDMTTQAQALMNRPHVVIATPGRIKDHLINDEDMAGYFSKARFLVLDEADRLLEAGFEDELRTVLQSLPPKRQTLLFSATMTGNLKALQELNLGNEKPFFYEGGNAKQTTVASLKQQYIFLPANAKDVYLVHLLSNLEELSVRSVMIFAASCRTCHLLSLIMEELDIDTTALHSMKLQQQRLMSLNRFKAGQVPILIATDVASRGLDIPTVDLVINYDLPRLSRDYIHRVGRTARAGRGGLAVSLVTQYDVDLVQRIEDAIGKKLDEYETEEDAVLKGITKVYKAKRLASLKMLDSGFEDKVKARRDLKFKSLKDKGLKVPEFSKHKRKRKHLNAD